MAADDRAPARGLTAEDRAGDAAFTRGAGDVATSDAGMAVLLADGVDAWRAWVEQARAAEAAQLDGDAPR